MPYVEQAVFTSAVTDRAAGYQVVGKSPGVREADAKELAIWGPSHDSLLELGPEAVSFNFHPLSSGAYCVSRTTPAGWEYSGRGGHRVYTQCLIVPPEVLGRFANNPFALIRAAVAGGMWQIHDEVPKRLEPLRFAGGAAPVDQTLLARLAANPGPERFAAMVHAALDSACLAVAGPPSAGQLIAGLFSCLPSECRTGFSFSTGLKFSSRRPFRLVALSGDQAEQRWVAHQQNVTVLDLSDASSACSRPVDGWARLIGRVLCTGRTSFLATHLSKRRFQLTLEDLSALGLQLLEDLDASALCSDHEDADLPPFLHADEEGESPATPAADDWPEEEARREPSERRHAHAAHCQFAKTAETTGAEKTRAVPPSQNLEATSPEILEKLELLDDVVYDAIAGQSTALERLERLWPRVVAELGDERIAESREQYLRYALSIWEECLDQAGVHNAARAVQALDVLCLLFDEIH